MDSEDPFFLNHNICGKAKQILSQFNIPLLNYQSLLVSYEELSIIHQISFTPYKTTYKAFYQQKIVFAEVYNLAYAPSSFSSKEDQIGGIEASSARDNEGETTEKKNEREEDVRIQLMIQLSIMKALSHENFVDLIGVGYFQYHIDLPPQILVISDYNEHNLDDISSLEIQEGYKSSWKERMSWLKEIVSGLLLLEKYQITVKELTARNIFFNIHFKVKMKVSYDIEDMIKPATTPFEEEKNQPLINIASQFITPRNVIFSFGSILFQIITGKSFQQYFSNPSSSSSLPNVEAVTVIDGCPEALRLLMIECINHYQRSSSGDSQSTVVPIFSIQEIWKQLDQIWNLTFPPENPSNQLLRRNSLSATQSKLSFKVKNNPFEDSEDEERERYYQDGIPTHRPSVATRRISMPTQDSMENMFAQYQPPSQTSPSQHRPSSLKTNPFNNSNEHSPFPSPKGQFLFTSVSELNKLIPPSFDRKEDIIQYLIYFLNRTFQETELQLNEHLELVENLYIVEAPASAHLNDPQMKAKKQKEVLGFRQSIESFFLQLETIKKQLVFLYLYCDLEETDDLNQTGLKQLPDGSNFQSLEEKDSLRRTSHNQLLQLLNEILNDAPTSTADSFTGSGPATTTEEIYHFYRHNSQTLPSAEMKRRLSILRQESTIDAAVIRRPSHSTEEQFDEKRLFFRQQSHPISAPIANEDATGMTRNSSLIRRRSIEIDSAEVPGSQPTSDVKKRSSFLINDQEKSPMKEEAVHKVVLSDIRKSVSVKKDSQPLEEEYAAPSESRKSVNVSVPLAGSQALRTEQLSPLKNPATIEQKVNPPLSLHQRLFNQQDEPFVADTVPTESLTFINPPIPPPPNMIQPTPRRWRVRPLTLLLLVLLFAVLPHTKHLLALIAEKVHYLLQTSLRFTLLL